MHELAIPQQRCPTVTGGLTFAGGPLNSYSLHAIAALVLQLRREPGTAGLITANGGFLTKHAFGVYAGEPPVEFRHADVQAEIDALPQREPALDFAGEIEIEGCTVMHGPQGPSVAYACGLSNDGRRAWGRSDDPALMQAMMQEELCGQRARIEPGGVLHVK
jgi:acetyl-CoA C-acetyltransferase